MRRGDRSPREAPASVRPPAPGLFVFIIVLSGAAALIYQVAWTRSLTLLFGVST